MSARSTAVRSAGVNSGQRWVASKPGLPASVVAAAAGSGQSRWGPVSAGSAGADAGASGNGA
ncbi:hypothetical protein, partial [Streptomyces sp. CO7]